MIERTIAATIHGRYLVETPSGGAPVGTLVGCHGYAEPAEAQLERMRALVCRGSRDEWYTTAKFDADIGRLRVAGASVTPLAFDGGHEWSDAVNQAAGVFLHAVLAR